MFEDDRYLTADPLLRMAAGTIFSSMLQVGIDLDVFAKLKGKAVPVEELGALWEMPSSSARVLAQYLTHMGALEYRDGQVANAALSEAYLCEDTWTRSRVHYFSRGAGFDVRPEKIKERLLNPGVHRWYQIKDGELDPREEIWWGGRQEYRIVWGEKLAAQYDFSDHKLLLDVGGATGGWCIGVRRRFPKLRCVVFEIPGATELARELVEDVGEGEWISVVEGSFFTDPLPEGADVALLANVLHDWTPEISRDILGKVFEALEDDGIVLVKEFFLEDDWSGATESVVQAMWVVGPEERSGWQPSYAEMETMLAGVGFVDVERRECLVLGRKPKA